MHAASQKASHVDRTATEPRDSQIHSVTISQVDRVNDDIRLFRLGIREGSSIEFLPGQWLDTFVPGVAKPGGFTITSPPSKARLPTSPYLELAVQESPLNPPAAWLWEKASVGARLRVRFGGAFVWPPASHGAGADLASLRRVVLVAGGVGVNPLMSILSHLAEEGDAQCPYDIQFLYSVKAPAPSEKGAREDLDAQKILFVERLAAIYGREKIRGRFRLFLTGQNAALFTLGETMVSCYETDIPFEPRRMTLDDVADALGPDEERDALVVYVCGLPSMTDEFVEKIISPNGLGLKSAQVLCEKWW